MGPKCPSSWRIPRHPYLGRPVGESLRFTSAGRKVQIDILKHDELRRLQRPGKPDVLLKVLQKYLAKVPLYRANISQAIDALDAKKLWVAAHTLKSSSAQLGAHRLAPLCAELERLGRENQLAGISQCRAALEQELELVVEEFQRIIEQGQLRE